MEPETWVAIFAAVVALVALFFTGMSAISANTQTKIQRQLRIDAAQPYVWADIRPDESVGVILNVVVGNSGPTVATNVRVTVDPPLPRIDQFNERIDRVEHRLAEGLKSLAPGRQLRWPLGQGFALVNKDGPQAYTFIVTADGPFGPVPPLTYVVDTSDWREITDRPVGSLHEVKEAIRGLAGAVQSLASIAKTDQEE